MRSLFTLCAASLAFSCAKTEPTKVEAQQTGEPGTQSAEASSDSKPADNVSLNAIDAFIKSKGIDKSANGWKTRLPKPPQVKFEDGNSYYWNLETNVGVIKVKLNPQVAPMHVSSTIYLTRLGFYDDVVFHRVIKGFMAQGGDPLGRGTGGPGYNYNGEFSPTVKHDRPGLLSMANAGPGTDGSQFFITFQPTPHLDGRHTIFGEVVDGMDAVKKLEARGSRSGQTTEDLRIQKASIAVE
ncbi:MAG: peptidylprolyl isomerase [Verrucomicrobiaceae bacterium]|nr:peptidylprolyl isomerase [Verrucomicrobiaceae bacterium]